MNLQIFNVTLLGLIIVTNEMVLKKLREVDMIWLQYSLNYNCTCIIETPLEVSSPTGFKQLCEEQNQSISSIMVHASIT